MTTVAGNFMQIIELSVRFDTIEKVSSTWEIVAQLCIGTLSEFEAR